MLTVKSAQSESCELFYLGSNEDYSLRDSISDGSEKLLQSGWDGGRAVCVILCRASTCNHADNFCRTFLLATRSRGHREGEEMQELGS